MRSDWVEDLFIKKSDMFLVMMNAVWPLASEQALAIDKIIKKYYPSANRILDLMCGNGRISIHLSKLGYTVVWLDFSKKLLMMREGELGSMESTQKQNLLWAMLGE